MFGSIKRNPGSRRRRLTSRPKKKMKHAMKGGPLHLLATVCSRKKLLKDKEMPPPQKVERVQTEEGIQTVTTTKETDDENNVLFPNHNKNNHSERQEIAYVYRFVLNAPPSSDWLGKEGTIAQICNTFGWKRDGNKHNQIKKSVARL